MPDERVQAAAAEGSEETSTEPLDPTIPLSGYIFATELATQTVNTAKATRKPLTFVLATL